MPDVVTRATLYVLEDLAREMADAGRPVEEAALREVVHALSLPARGFLTADQAADRLGVSMSTVKGLIERGALTEGPKASCQLVASESVEHLVCLRASLMELDREGNPTPEEIQELYSPPQRTADQGVAAS